MRGALRGTRGLARQVVARPHTPLARWLRCMQDLCCKAHDKCCGHGDRKVCNDDIVACLNNCDDLSVTCTRDDIPVPAGTSASRPRAALAAVHARAHAVVPCREQSRRP